MRRGQKGWKSETNNEGEKTRKKREKKKEEEEEAGEEEEEDDDEQRGGGKLRMSAPRRQSGPHTSTSGSQLADTRSMITA